MIIDSVDVKNYAYILHDNDIDPETKQLKKAHYHYLIYFGAGCVQRGAWFKQFTTEDMGSVLYEPCKFPENAYNYLLHADEKSVKKGKHLYPEKERVSTFEKFDEAKDEDEAKQIVDFLFAVAKEEAKLSDLFFSIPKTIYSAKNFKEVITQFRLDYAVHNRPESLTAERMRELREQGNRLLGIEVKREKIRLDELEAVEDGNLPF